MFNLKYLKSITMNRKLLFLIFILIVINIPITTFATSNNNNEEYCVIGITILVPKNFKNDIVISFKDVDKVNNYDFLLTSKNGYEGVYGVRLCDYEFSYLIKGTTDYELKGNKNLYELKNKNSLSCEFTIEEIDKNKVTVKNETIHVDDLDVFSNIDNDTSIENEYFPNMSLNEVAKWYKESVEPYVSELQELDGSVDTFIKQINNYCGSLSPDNKNSTRLYYKYYVDIYKPDTEIYKIQYKMYSFINDLFENQDIIPDFNWTGIEEETRAIESTEILESTHGEYIETIEQTYATEQTEITTYTTETTEQIIETEDTNKFISLFKKAWVSLVIIIIMLTVCFVINKKYKNKD